MGVATIERWERAHPPPISGLDYFETELPKIEDRRTPPKLPKLEHVALNSASETGAQKCIKMHRFES